MRELSDNEIYLAALRERVDCSVLTHRVEPLFAAVRLGKFHRMP